MKGGGAMDLTEVTNHDLLIHALELKPRVHYGLRRLGIRTIGQLVAFTPKELLSHKGIGPDALMEVRLALAEAKMTLRDDPNANYFLSGEAGTRSGWKTQQYRYRE